MGWFGFTSDVDTVAGLTVKAEDIAFTLAEVATATTLTADHFMIAVNASGNTKITLPAAASHTDRMYTIKNIHSSGTVTIDANGTETIDGEQTIELKLQYSYITIVCDGDEWFIIGGEYVKMEDTLSDILEEQRDTREALEKALYYLVMIQKQQVEISEQEIDIDQEEIEEELKELIIETSD